MAEQNGYKEHLNDDGSVWLREWNDENGELHRENGPASISR